MEIDVSNDFFEEKFVQTSKQILITSYNYDTILVTTIFERKLYHEKHEKKDS